MLFTYFLQLFKLLYLRSYYWVDNDKRVLMGAFEIKDYPYLQLTFSHEVTRSGFDNDTRELLKVK